MCGVCGIIPLRPSRTPEDASDRVAGMMRALAHRGPDDSSLAVSDTAALGATRLAIRGLASGKQPIVHATTGLVAVCNGEIDNHRELRAWLADRGRRVEQETDIAVIPELYLELGENFVERLQGVFAIAIWDPDRQRVLLARDRAGERPLFYAIGENVVRFATEVAAMVSDSRDELTISKTAMVEYLQHGCFISPSSPFNEIYKVAPGEIVLISCDEVTRRRYWRWNICSAPKRLPDLDQFDQIFRGAVRRQTEADVPFGVFLSGGLDSSLTAAVARSLHPDRSLNAYTLRFDESSYDEGAFAARVAEQLQLNPVTVWIKPEDFRETLRQLLDCGGEPLADPAWVPTALLARRAARDVKLALAGEGGDEIFGGYPTYLAAQINQTYARLPKPLRAGVRSIVNRWPDSDKKMTLPSLLKRFVNGAHIDGVARHLFWKANVSETDLTRLGVQSAVPLAAQIPFDVLMDALQQIDMEMTLAEGLLTKSDRAGMASAVEVRAPFLDQSVMEFAATLPVNQRVHGIQTKSFLKKYATRYLPKNIIHRRKRGLSVPLKQWLREPLYEWARESICSGALDEAGISSRAALEMLEEHRRQQSDHTRALWSVIVLAEWLRWLSGRPGK
jgi:asparagine synthase (glutamine-hydrolysing)